MGAACGARRQYKGLRRCVGVCVVGYPGGSDEYDCGTGGDTRCK